MAISISIRQATRNDRDTIAEFNCRLAAESEDRQLDRSVVRSGVAAALERQDLCQYFVAECDGQTIGQLMVTYEWSDWRDGVIWWIQSVYVRPAHRRRGVFRTMYRYVDSVARATPGVCGTRVYVRRDNTQAIASYAQAGLLPSGYIVLECDWSEASTGRPDVDPHGGGINA